MARASVFASPAIYEPFGLAVLEAAQLGTPLALADTPVFRELWSEAALFVAPHDAHGWADALNVLLHNDDERARLGHAAYTRASAYTQARMVSATMALHQRVQPPSRHAA